MYSTSIHDFMVPSLIKSSDFPLGVYLQPRVFAHLNIFLKLITMYLIVLLGKSSKKKGKCKIPEEAEIKDEVDDEADAEVHKDDENDEIEILPCKFIIPHKYIL